MSFQPRRERDTVRREPFRALIPLLGKSNQFTSVKFGSTILVKRDAILLSRRGTLGVAYSIKSPTDYSCDVPSAINEFTSVRNQLAELVVTDLNGIGESYPIASATEMDGPGDPFCFECIDFDSSIDGGFSISNLLRHDQIDDARTLCGFFRMTRPEVTKNYRTSFCCDFLNRSFGNRDDEIWITESRRLFRRHPEARSRSDVAAHWEDVVLTSWLFLARACELEGLHDVCTELLRTLRSEFSMTRHIPTGKMYGYFSRYERIASEIVDPLSLERHSVHGFFRRVMQELSVVLEIDSIHHSLLKRAEEVQSMIGMISSYSTADASRVLTERTRSLNLWMLLITVLATILVAAQVFNISGHISEWLRSDKKTVSSISNEFRAWESR